MPRSKSANIKLRVYLAISLAFLPVFALSSSATANPTQIEVAQTALQSAQAEFQAAQDTLSTRDSELATASTNLQNAQAEKDTALAAYNASAVLVPSTLTTSTQNVVQNGTFDTASSWSNIGLGSSNTLTNSSIARVYDGVLVGSYVYSTYMQQVGTFSSPVRQVTFSYDMSNNNDNYGNRPQADQYRVEFRTYSANGTRLNYYNTGDRADIFPWTHFSATYTLPSDAVRWDVGFRMSDTGYWNGNFAGSIDNVSVLAQVTSGTPEHTEYGQQETSNLSLKVQALATAQAAYNLAVTNQAAAVTRLTLATSNLSAAQAALAQAEYDAIIPTSAPNVTTYLQGDSQVTVYPSLPNNEAANTWFYRVISDDTNSSCLNPYAGQTLNSDGAPQAITISGLTNDCQYQIAVANWNGKSSEYTFITVKPRAPLVLNEPTNVQVSIIGNSAHITWDAPAASNAQVERYAIFWSYDNFQSGFGIPSQTTEATIPNLIWSSDISFKVRADNDTTHTYSSFSSPVAVSTPSDPSNIPVPVVTPTAEPTATTTPDPAPVVDPTPDPTPIVTPDPVAPTTSLYPQGSVFLSADEGNSINYSAPAGYIISNVLFASYGTPNNYAIDGCHADTSSTGVSSAATATSLSISADNGVFGDPCGGTYKKLEVVLVLAVDPNYTSPDPTPAPEPTPSPTQDPIILPEPTATPTPTQTPEPPLPPVPSPTPQPTVEPSPTPTIPEPQPSPTPTQTQSPEPSPTVEPTATPEPQPTQSSSPEPTPTSISTPEPTKEPTPPVETPVEKVTKAEDLPEVISVAQLMEVKLDEIIATDLSPKQAEALKEAALQTFETAVAGSPEYAQALDALLVAAKADDIVLSPELAAIPGAAALVDAINLLSNVGADISPKVRAEAQKATVAAVIVGQIAGAAASVATSSSSSSRSSSNTRKAK